MKKRKKQAGSGAILDLWRPPQGAGEPIGCLASTYTFHPSLFDEQCLARFLEIESEPDREDLAFLLERERCLGSVYAGVLVDYTQAGVEHSLRWDVLPVRVPGAIQHAKLSLLAWSRHVRIIVASANLSEPGYRTNYEVAGAIDLSPAAADLDRLAEAVAFLEGLLTLVPGAAQHPRDVQRAVGFLRQVERQAKGWPAAARGTVRQRLVFTLPKVGAAAGRSALDEVIEECQASGGSPARVKVASPFFDTDGETCVAAAALCKRMARGKDRRLTYCVPALREAGATTPRLAAPRSLLSTSQSYQGVVDIAMLPEMDEAKNRRIWHGKMVALRADTYEALMIGSSNFTCAGLGVGSRSNAEANLLTVVKYVEHGRESGQLKAVWPETEAVANPEAAEWIGSRPEEEDELAKGASLPAGFLAATYRAGDHRVLVLRLEPAKLPADWRIHACGQDAREVLGAASWSERGAPAEVELPWEPVLPPEKLRVEWEGNEAFLPLNVEDSGELPPPPQLDQMSADDMLRILAASDPSAAFRSWAKNQQPSDLFDADLDSATPIDLDPLRRYDLHTTFLHRVRRKARVLAQLRENLQRPVWGKQALEWRLRGMVGVEALADRLARECASANGAADEALLTLSDFLIVLKEVDYQPVDGSLSKAEFNRIYTPFLAQVAAKLAGEVAPLASRMSGEMQEFWGRVVERCQSAT